MAAKFAVVRAGQNAEAGMDSDQLLMLVWHRFWCTCMPTCTDKRDEHVAYDEAPSFVLDDIFMQQV